MYHWDDLIEYIHQQKRVIPIVGKEFSLVRQDDEWWPLEKVLIQRMGADAELAAFAAQCTEQEKLPDFLRQLLSKGAPSGSLPQHLDAAHRELLKQLGPEDIHPSLRKLAAIQDFPLWISTTPDGLLALALKHAHGGNMPVVVADTISTKTDLPSNWSGFLPLVYQLFGKIGSTPTYALTEEDTLEFVSHLFAPNRRPEKLFDRLRTHHLLLLGTCFPDWLARFFLRLLKDRPLGERRDTIETLADPMVTEDPRLVTFLQLYSQQTRVYRDGSTLNFADELHRRWELVAGAQPAGTTKEAAVDLPEMVPGAVFISYASEDRDAALALATMLERHNIDAWLDKHRLVGGDHYDTKIRKNIERCDAFVPLISRSTEARNQGYVFKEWGWAVTHHQNLPPNRKFFFPVVLDDTAARDTDHVPQAMRQGIHIERMQQGQLPDSYYQSLIAELRRLRAARA